MHTLPLPPPIPMPQVCSWLPSPGDWPPPLLPGLTLNWRRRLAISYSRCSSMPRWRHQNLPQKRCPCLTNQEKESSRLKRLPKATRLARGKARTQAHPLLQKNARAGWQRILNGRFWNVGIIKKKTEKQLLIFFPDSKSNTRSW